MMQQIEPSFHERHRHRSGYAALVLSGKYEEVGDTGRWSIEEGDVVYHRPFEAHANRILTSCKVVNILIPPFVRLPSVFRVVQSEDLIKFANLGWPELSELLIPHETKTSFIFDWCDRLAEDLQKQPIRLNHWAEDNGLRSETLSRQFKKVYGVSPARYRFSAQTRLALDLITHRVGTLAEIAFQSGFADQAHMSRAVKMLTGYSPAAWQKINSVQESGSATM